VDTDLLPHLQVSVDAAGGDIDQSTGLANANEPVYNTFSSIPATLWFMIVTLMTVGYGDMVPTTVVGQLVTGVAMVCSMLVLALPISVIGTNFTQVCFVPRYGAFL
jgi:voltage-gated potassium channel Kch